MKVSVLMPTYNREDMLKKAVQSFIDQDYENAELIILNNGSTDNTSEVIKSFTDQRIKYLHCVTNIKPPKNLNYLWDFASGELICQLHDDDQLTKESLSTRVKKFHDNSSVQVVYGGWITGDRIYPGLPPDKERILREEYINFTTMMYRTDLKYRLDEDFEYYFDWYFKIKCLKNCVVDYVKEPVMKYQIHSGQESIKCRREGKNAIEERLMRSKL